jgi:hypothetical protein
VKDGVKAQHGYQQQAPGESQQLPGEQKEDLPPVPQASNNSNSDEEGDPLETERYSEQHDSSRSLRVRNHQDDEEETLDEEKTG